MVKEKGLVISGNRSGAVWKKQTQYNPAGSPQKKCGST